MTVVEGAVRSAEECVVDFPVSESGCKWHVSACESFGEAEEVWNHIFLLAGEHRAGAAEAGHDFIQDEVHAACVAPSAQLGKHPGWPDAHFIDSLDEWLDDDGGDFFRGQSTQFVE